MEESLGSFSEVRRSTTKRKFEKNIENRRQMNDGKFIREFRRISRFRGNINVSGFAQYANSRVTKRRFIFNK